MSLFDELVDEALKNHQEMSRFLPIELVSQTVNQAAFWTPLARHIADLHALVERTLDGDDANPGFKM